jgi:hypothetical protein
MIGEAWRRAEEWTVPQSVADAIVALYRQAHERTLALAREMPEELFDRRPEGTNSVAWNLWHVARFADLTWTDIASAHPAFTQGGAHEQIWLADGLAARWGFDGVPLGRHATGWGMPEEAAAGMRFDRAELVGYAERAYVAAFGAAAVLDDATLGAELVSPHDGSSWSYGRLLVMHTGHASRHLGMMEAVRGLLVGHGTVTV